MTAPATSQAADSAAAIEAWLNGLYSDLHASSQEVKKQLEERISEGSKISTNRHCRNPRNGRIIPEFT